MHIKICKHCYKVFFTEVHFRRFCGLGCSAKFRVAHPSEKVKTHLQELKTYGGRGTRGKHGFGCNARDNINHKSAKQYRLRSPLGIVYEVKNLRSWCRKNELIFTPDDFPYSRTTLARRASISLQKVSVGDIGSWKGWTAVCVFDIEKDPLDRAVGDVLPLPV